MSHNPWLFPPAEQMTKIISVHFYQILVPKPTAWVLSSTPARQATSLPHLLLSKELSHDHLTSITCRTKNVAQSDQGTLRGVQVCLIQVLRGGIPGKCGAHPIISLGQGTKQQSIQLFSASGTSLTPTLRAQTVALSQIDPLQLPTCPKTLLINMPRNPTELTSENLPLPRWISKGRKRRPLMQINQCKKSRVIKHYVNIWHHARKLITEKLLNIRQRINCL